MRVHPLYTRFSKSADGSRKISQLSGDFLDGPCWDRTSDLGIKSPLLYQLSYRPEVSEYRPGLQGSRAP